MTPRLLAATVLFLSAGCCCAQVVGASVSGVVKDATGGALPGTQVEIKNVETGATRKLATDDSGRYAAPSIPVGVIRSPLRKKALGRRPEA